jgi:hypothetical protein
MLSLLAGVLVLASCASGSPAAQSRTATVPPRTGAAGASAIPSPATNRFRQGETGTIAGLWGSMITLNTVQGQSTVNLEPNAVIQTNVPVAQADLKVGQILSAVGTVESGITLASRITLRTDNISPPQFAQPSDGSSVPPVTPWTARPSRSPFSGVPGGGGGFPGRLGGSSASAAFGELSSIDGSTVTVTSSQSQQTTFLIAAGTIIEKASAGSPKDLKVGERVTVMGAPDASGEIQVVYINVDQGVP